MRNCLITGVDGLIGSNLIDFLLKNNWNIYGLTRQSHHSNPYVNYIYADLSKEWTSSILPKKIDVIIHLAQSEFYRDFPKSVEHLFCVNTLSTLRLLDYARQAEVKTFILASSGGIYGYSNDQFIEDQHEPVSPFKESLNFYLGSKLCAEIISENFSSFFNIVTLRFFFVYGQKQKANMLIPRLIRSVCKGLPITLQGSEGLKINPTYITDAVQAINAAMSLNASHKINIAGPEIMTMREIANTIGEVVGQKPLFNIEMIEAKNLIGDIKKMSEILIPPSVDFCTGIKYLIASNEYSKENV